MLCMTTVMLPHRYTQLFATLDTSSWLYIAASLEITVLYIVSKEQACHKYMCMFLKQLHLVFQMANLSTPAVMQQCSNTTQQLGAA